MPIVLIRIQEGGEADVLAVIGVHVQRTSVRDMLQGLTKLSIGSDRSHLATGGDAQVEGTAGDELS